MKKQFHIGHIISVYDGHLITNTQPPIDAVYEILNFMSGDDLHTNQLPRVAEEVRPYLAEQFPWLKDEELIARCKEITRENWRDILNEFVAKYGEFHDVRPMHGEDHEVIDPISEWNRQRPDAPAITLNMTDEPPISPTGDINWKV